MKKNKSFTYKHQYWRQRIVVSSENHLEAEICAMDYQVHSQVTNLEKKLR